VPLPASAYVAARGQYRAEPLLALVSGHGARHVLALTHRDLYAGDLNFVFGIASPRGACVVSTARLAAGADEALFRARLVKEAVHELGHTLGLEHCADRGCVMHFSNRLADTDRKGDAYCGRCAAAMQATSRRRRS
jgi:archaemetzincin